MNNKTKTLRLYCSEKELNEVVSGERAVITREVRPNNARRFLELNEDEECVGVRQFENGILTCRKNSAEIEVTIAKIMLMEIEDENGELVHYEYHGRTYQMAEADIYLESVTKKKGMFPLTTNKILQK